jgi:monofunctional glycosyltransferase
MTIETQSDLAPPPKRFLERLKPWQRWAAYGLGFIVAWPILMTIVYTIVPPPFSNLMILRLFTGNGLTKDWVSIDDMSPYLARAVITSEDARFCDVFDDDEGPIRGASTISMQTAKNMFLWDGRNFIRKGLEVPMAYWMDFVWSKRRMMEIYLNIVEWAPGVYGAEAASQFHFHKPAAKLSRREAALLAAVLPNPIKRKAGKPSKRVNFIANRIIGRMSGMGGYLTCIDG